MTPAGDDILLRLSSLQEPRLRVGADHDLGCIEIEVDGLASGHSPSWRRRMPWTLPCG